MNIPWTIALAVLSLVAATVALLLALESHRYAQRAAARTSADALLQQWWSDDLRRLRDYFFTEFIPRYRAKLVGRGMRDIERIIPEDGGRVTRLCDFFDRVGWMGAAGFVDLDYVLGPMQHTMRRTWMVMEPLIAEERKRRSVKLYDPVYQHGFEWLFEHSSQSWRHLANLVGHKLLRPRTYTEAEIRALRAEIDRDEAEFRQRLQEILGTQQ